MFRFLIHNLIEWANKADHPPLILRGPRQVGKSYLVEYFGKTHFSHFVSVNFELNPELATCFNASLDPHHILKELSLLGKKNIIPGKTLLFLDEIQLCSKAIQALRYFKELLPELHVIAAGSLLEFALKAADFSMPVGRVTFRYLKPLSFQEFLLALQEEELLAFLKTVDFQRPPSEAVHQRLLNFVQEYTLTGGMPAVVQAYLETKNWLAVAEKQSALLQTYRNDFPKYAKTHQFKYLERLFERAPLLLGQQFKFSRIDPDMLARDLRVALTLLIDAGILTPIYACSASGLPLAATRNDKKFKLAFLDIGLAQRACGLDISSIAQQPLLQIQQGALAEQLVAQEFLAYAPNFEPAHLYYWEREKQKSQAEIDYVLNIHNQIIPVEVKAGKTGRLKSLHVFMQEKHSLIGLKISQDTLCIEKNILTVPFYLIAELPRLVGEAA